MRLLFVSAFVILGSFPSNLAAQMAARGRGGVHPGAFTPGRFGSGVQRLGLRHQRQNTFGAPFGLYDPFYGAGYANYYDGDGYQSQPMPNNVVVVMPQPQLEMLPPPPPPPLPIRPEIREYSWPVSSPHSAATFSIVFNDHR